MRNLRSSLRCSGLRTVAILLGTVMYLPVFAHAQDVGATQLPTGGQVVAGQAAITQNGARMDINQATDRAAIDWSSFNIGAQAHVNFVQPTANSVALNRVTGGGVSQIFGKLTANGRVYITNANGVYFAHGSSVNVGAILATTHDITNNDFMAGRDRFIRNGADGEVVNEGTIEAPEGGFVALLAPEVRNEGVITARLGSVHLAAGEAFELQFDEQSGLSDITVSPSAIKALVSNGQAAVISGGTVVLSAHAINKLQGGVVKNEGAIEATGLVNKGGVVRLSASKSIELGGRVKADAAADSAADGGRVVAIADLSNKDSSITFTGKVSARAGAQGGNGGFVETSGSHVTVTADAGVDTGAPKGATGEWLIDPYDYDINGAAAAAISTALDTTNVQVTTTADNTSYGSNGNAAGTGNITVSSAISSASANQLRLTADGSINIAASITSGKLVLDGPGGITLGANISTLTDMTINGNVTLSSNVTLTSGISNTYTAYTVYTVPVGVTSVTATLVGGAGGRGGDDGGNQGGSAGSVGSLIAAFDVTPGQTLYIAPGAGGGAGGNSVGNGGAGSAGTNQFNVANGGAGGVTGPQGTSGGGGGGGAATIIALTNTPTTASALLLAGGGGGGGGSGNNTACPGLCASQSSANYRPDSVMTGEAGYNAGNQGASINDGGASGGGGGGLVGGVSNQSVFFVNEWTGRGGNVGQSGAANGFTTTMLSTSVASAGNSAGGSAIISYGGGTVAINGTVDGAYALNVVARSSDVDITGAIGGSTALASLNVIGSQGISLDGGAVTTTGAQTYTGPLILDANSTAFTSNSNGAITFGGNVLKGAGVDGDISVSNGSGAVSFNGDVGSSGTPVGAVSVTSTGTTTLSGAVYGTSFTKAGSGKTAISGGLVRTSAGQSYAGVVDLGGDAQLRSTGTGNIVLNGAVSNSTQSDLTISAAGGDVTLNGNLAVGTNSRPTPIGDVSITASGTVTLGSSGTPISGDASSLTINADTLDMHANSSTSFTCGTGASAVGMCLTGPASFTVASASSIAGPIAGTASFTKAGAGVMTLTGSNTFTGNMNVSGGKLDITGSGRLGNGNYGGNIAVGSQIRFSGTASQTLGGTMSGAGFINSPGAGNVTITTLSNADHYNLINAYVVPKASSGPAGSVYGNTPSVSYDLATTAAGGTVITLADPSGTAAFTGVPTATSNVGNYSISYSGGITLGNEQYNLAAGNALSWSVSARPLNLTVSKVYNGSNVFSSGFTLSGTVNGDALPALSGSGTTASANAGTYNAFASSTLSLDNANYTLAGGNLIARITGKPLTIIVSKTYDGSLLFTHGFTVSGLGAGEQAPTVIGTASVSGMSPGTYDRFISNNLVLGDGNYTLDGVSVLATINPAPPALPVNTTPQVPPPADAQNTAGLLPPSSDGGTPVAPASDGVVPAPVQDGGGVTYSSEDKGVVVSLVKEPSAKASGIVNVVVRNDTSGGTGFSFPLPDQIAVKTEGPDFSVKTAQGGNLPGWLRFDKKTKVFSAASVPEGGLPIEIVISSGDERTTILITEGQ